RDHLLVVSRTSSNAIYVLDALTGEPLRSLNVPGTVVTGGTFVVSMIACSDDGQVFAANLTTDGNTTPFKIYHWANDDSTEVPTLIFSGNPGGGTSDRWGDTLDARGSGVDVDLLMGGRNGKLTACIFFAPDADLRRLLTIITPDAETANFGLGITFGRGNTFWGKATGTGLRQVSFDPETGAGTVITTITNYNNMAPIDFYPTRNLLAGISIETPDNVRLLDVTGGSVLELDTKFFSDFPNSNGAGQARFGNERLFVLDANNGIVAYALRPKIRASFNAGTVTLDWDGIYNLQFSPEAAGPYTNLVNEPPHVFEPAQLSPGSRGFFRLAPIQ
ncbi:MAG TPA: DUF4623 domain-containing protein, partial [Candidatus Acidoferrum sp.]|nr:DUF4623 domain-containing protein [Candidatus Acidoferrum sp.]